MDLDLLFKLDKFADENGKSNIRKISLVDIGHLYIMRGDIQGATKALHEVVLFKLLYFIFSEEEVLNCKKAGLSPQVIEVLDMTRELAKNWLDQKLITADSFSLAISKIDRLKRSLKEIPNISISK